MDTDLEGGVVLCMRFLVLNPVVLQTPWVSRPAFQNFKASKSGDRQILCYSTASCFGFWSPIAVKE